MDCILLLRWALQTYQEYLKQHTGLIAPGAKYLSVDARKKRMKRDALPQSVDLRNTGCITPVFNQVSL